MIDTIIETQNIAKAANRGEHMTLLYEAIKLRISETCFSRARTDEDELLHVLFMRLEDEPLPPFGSEEMTARLDDEIRNAIRIGRREKMTRCDLDELDPEDEPFYDPQTKIDEQEFEETFHNFCDSCEEPERSVFRRSRTHTRVEIARSTGVSHQELTRILRQLPKKFQYFVKNHSNSDFFAH